MKFLVKLGEQPQKQVDLAYGHQADVHTKTFASHKTPFNAQRLKLSQAFSSLLWVPQGSSLVALISHLCKILRSGFRTWKLSTANIDLATSTALRLNGWLS